MKTFVFIENRFGSAGLAALQSIRTNRFNAKNVTILLLLGINMCLIGLYIVITANDFREYIYSLCIFSTALFLLINFTNLVFQIPNRIKFIVKFKNTVSKSKLDCSVFRSLLNFIQFRFRTSKPQIENNLQQNRWKITKNI